MAGEILGLSVALLGRQMPGRVEDQEVGSIEMRGEPIGLDNPVLGAFRQGLLLGKVEDRRRLIGRYRTANGRRKAGNVHYPGFGPMKTDGSVELSCSSHGATGRDLDRRNSGLNRRDW